jgi:hypothetical protein
MKAYRFLQTVLALVLVLGPLFVGTVALPPPSIPAIG